MSTLRQSIGVNKNWHEGGLFCREKPDVALLLVLSAQAAGPEVILPALKSGQAPELTGKAAAILPAALPHRIHL